MFRPAANCCYPKYFALENFCVYGQTSILVRFIRTVVPKLFRAVTQIKVAIWSYYPQYFAVIAQNIEQNCGFGSALPPEESHITTGG